MIYFPKSIIHILHSASIMDLDLKVECCKDVGTGLLTQGVLYK